MTMQLSNASPLQVSPLRSILAALALSTTLACTDDGGDEGNADATESVGDGDGDGDGDGAGDGDGDEAGDGDGEQPGDGDGDGDGELVLSDVIVNITYAGEQTGTLSIAALTSFPPEGPPVAALTNPTPTFPFTGTLKDLEVGELYIIAVLDIGDNNPQSPGPEDLVALTPAPITVTGEDTPTVELEFMD